MFEQVVSYLSHEADDLSQVLDATVLFFVTHFIQSFYYGITKVTGVSEVACQSLSDLAAWCTVGWVYVDLYIVHIAHIDTPTEHPTEVQTNKGQNNCKQGHGD